MFPESSLLIGIDKFVKEEIEKENIPKDAKLVVIGTVDLSGAKVVAAVDLTKNLQIKSIFKHEWDGDNEVAAKLIFAK